MTSKCSPFLWLAVFILARQPLWAETSRKPNFLVIMGEAQGWASASVQMDDQNPASKGRLVRTPNLEKIAAAGTRFAEFYAASPRCTPTRAAFFTGKSPTALHMTFVNEGRKDDPNDAGRKVVPPHCTTELPESELTIAGLLKKEGYATAHFGKWHVGRANPNKHGFEENDGPNNNGGPEDVENPNPKQAFKTAESGMDFMARQARANKPFYLQISHYAGRGGADARPETYAEVRRRVTSDRDSRMVGPAAVNEDMDATLGMLVAKLEELGIAENTYFIYTSDHGAQGHNDNGPLAGGKGTVREGGVRVPLILRGPGINAGACSHVRASTVDLFPTIAALAQAKEALPRGIEGVSLVPALKGDSAPVLSRPQEEFVVHFPHYDKDAQGPASTLLLGKYKLVRLYESGELRLYELAADLGETRDLAREQASLAADLDRRLSEYLKAVGAQMPTENPSYDPAKARPFEERKGGRKKNEEQAK
ncbi:MAG: sulfatase [Verrucomicrobia bacterium]|nr:sulfatase [Verrucomicrobiota bacterium]